ncbi:sugar ABC transporter ATP-binding protein [Cellulomonas sp. KRMCY2]|uniref:sugar ABC transporter ATP-binding protein n=1 Tax=Cellulomonas sp. KRMCY2 TaxID=1304865 RepID=UPI00045E9228|nr:sugar ABC transporter ATP-binding protein [Cellulomonas sp. KRMCY2]
MLVAQGLTKSYGGVHALLDGRIRLEAGQIHALVGENGAGKSTMVKILSGVERRDAGTIEIEGRRTEYDTPREAAAHGIAIVSQELSLFPDLSVAENLFAADLPLHRGLLDVRSMAQRARPVLEQLGLDVSMRVRVGMLPLADQQLLEIARALLSEPRVLILDEPTSALPAAAALRLEGVLHALAARGIALLYISHYLEEVRRIADRISVLRDGEVVVEGAAAGEVSLAALVEAMLGDQAAPVAAARPATVGSALAPSLTLEHVSVAGVLTDIDLAVAPGEIVGVAGLEGAGHLTVLEVVCGIARPTSGRVRLPGGGAPRSVRQAVRAGVAFVPGDRKKLGLMLDKTVWENATSVRWLGQGKDGPMLRRDELVARAGRSLERMRFKGDVHAAVGELSGGNQQKVVFAKWMDADPSVVVLDDPTRGVDIGARSEMHELVRAIAAEQKVVLLASTDLAELTELCHRVVVLQRGRVVAELSGTELTEAALSVAMNAGFITTGTGPG